MDNYVNDKEFLFGEGTAQKVVFKKGSLSKAAAAAKTGAAGSIIFGKDETDGVGAIWVDGKLVTGKVLDFSHSHDDTTHEGTATFKLLGENGTVDTSTFTFVNAADVAAIQGDISRDVEDLSTRMAKVDTSVNTLESRADVVDGSIGTLKSRADVLDASVSAVETYLKDTNITEATNGAVTVTATGDGFKTYTVGVNVDDSTVKVVNNKLAVATYTLTKKTTADAGLASQYEFTTTPANGGTATTVTIDIPKDQFLKEAKLVWATKDDQGKYTEVEEGTTGAIHCLKFDWQLEDTSVGLAATYIELKDLASVYTAGDHITITNNEISVNVDTLADDVSTELGLGALFTKIDSSLSYLDSSIKSIETWINGAEDWQDEVDTHLAALDTSTESNATAIAANADAIAQNASDIDEIEASYLKSIQKTAGTDVYTIDIVDQSGADTSFVVPTTYIKTIVSNGPEMDDYENWVITPSSGEASTLSIPTTFVKSVSHVATNSDVSAFATTGGTVELSYKNNGDTSAQTVNLASEARVAALEQTLTWMELD